MQLPAVFVPGCSGSYSSLQPNRMFQLPPLRLSCFFSWLKLSPKTLPAAETCRGCMRWVSNLAEEALRCFNACKCPWPLAPELSDSPLQVLQMRGWFKIRLCFASHWPVKPGKTLRCQQRKQNCNDWYEKDAVLFCCCVLPELNWG